MGRGKIVIFSKQSPLTVMISEVVGQGASKVVCCCSAEQTLATCRYEMPALVIIVSITPFVDGSGLITHLRRSDKRHPPIYVISWQHSENAVLSLLECGVDQYFTFPISIARLRLKVAEQLKNDSER